MTDYTKTTDFTSKDSLPSGDSGKIIRGAEFGTEFDNIQTAVNSKSNKENPSFTGNITVTGTVDGRDISADGTKLDTIETSADVTDTANVTAAGAVMDSELTDITAVKALNQGVATTDSPTFAAVTSTGNVTVGGTVDGRDVAADGTKLDGIEAGATADQTPAQIKTAYESNANTNAFTDADESKLDGIEASADVTDTANVTAAGALMDSELTDIASVKALNQGVATTDSPTFAGATVNGTVEFDGLSGTGAVTVTDILDQDDMSSNSATALATQQSIKSYVDSQVATSDTLAEVLANGNATGGTDVAFGDNDKAIFGAGSDLQIYHSGSRSVITDQGTGPLRISATNLEFKNADDTKLYANATDGGAFNIYYDNTARLATTSTGIDVTGSITTDGLTSVGGFISIGADGAGDDFRFYGDTSGSYMEWVSSADSLLFRDGAKALFGNGSDLQVYHSGTHSYISDQGTGRLVLNSSGGGVRIEKSPTENMAIFTPDGNCELFYDNSLKLATSSTGIDVTGSVVSDGLTSAGDAAITGSSSGSTVLTLTSNALADTPLMVFQRSGGAVAGKLAYEDSNTAMSFGTTTAHELKFLTSNTERMQITSAGLVGIGTSSPDTSLHISEPSTATATVRLEQTDTTLVADQAVGVIEFEQNDAAGAGVPAKFGAFGENANAAVGLRFYTGTGATANERMRIDADGNVGIGTDSPRNDANFKTLQIGDSSTAASQLVLDDNDSNGPWRIISNLSLIINDDTAERMRIDSSGNVGIGESDPQELLHLTATTPVFRMQGGSRTYQQFVSGTDFVIRDVSAGLNRVTLDASGNVGIGVAPSSPLHVNVGTNQNLEIDSAGSELRLSAVNDARSTNPAIRFQAESYKFYGAGGVGPRATIDSSGRAIVGKTVADNGTVGITLFPEGVGSFVADGSRAATFVRKTDDGDLIQFRKDTSVVGSIGTSGGDLYIGTGDTALRFFDASDFIYPISTSTGTARDNAIDLGYSTGRFKDLYLSGTANVGGVYNTGIYNQQSGDIQFWVPNVGEAVRIQQNTGTLLVGGTSAYAASAITMTQDGILYTRRSGGSPATFRRDSDDGSIVTPRERRLNSR